MGCFFKIRFARTDDCIASASLRANAVDIIPLKKKKKKKMMMKKKISYILMNANSVIFGKYKGKKALLR